MSAGAKGGTLRGARTLGLLAVALVIALYVIVGGVGVQWLLLDYLGFDARWRGPYDNLRRGTGRCAVLTILMGKYEKYPHPFPEQDVAGGCDAYLLTDQHFDPVPSPWKVVNVTTIRDNLHCDSQPPVEPPLQLIEKWRQMSNRTWPWTHTESFRRMQYANDYRAPWCQEGRNSLRGNNTKGFNVAKLFKMQFHRLPIPRSDIDPPLITRKHVLWIDGSMQLAKPGAVAAMVDTLDQQEGSFGLYGHPWWRGDVPSEVEISIGRKRFGRYAGQDVVGQYYDYLSQGFCARWWRQNVSWPCSFQPKLGTHTALALRQAVMNRYQFNPQPGEYRGNYLARLGSLNGDVNVNVQVVHRVSPAEFNRVVISNSTGNKLVFPIPMTQKQRRIAWTTREWGLWVTNIILWRMSDSGVHRLLDVWWRQNVEYTTQDQIGMAYAVWRTQVLPATWHAANLRGNWDSSYWFMKHEHGEKGYTLEELSMPQRRYPKTPAPRQRTPVRSFTPPSRPKLLNPGVGNYALPQRTTSPATTKRRGAPTDNARHWGGAPLEPTSVAPLAFAPEEELPEMFGEPAASSHYPSRQNEGIVGREEGGAGGSNT